MLKIEHQNDSYQNTNKTTNSFVPNIYLFCKFQQTKRVSKWQINMDVKKEKQITWNTMQLDQNENKIKKQLDLYYQSILITTFKKHNLMS